MNAATCQQAGASPDRPPEASASELIRRYLRERPHASPADLVEWLAKFNVRLAPPVVDSLLAAMKSG